MESVESLRGVKDSWREDLVRMARAKPSTLGGFDQIRHPKKRTFLGRFAICGNIRDSCEASGITRQTHYNWLAADPDYAEAVDRAKAEAADHLEAEARRRAVEGVDKPLYYQGTRVDTIREYSDTLLIFLLKGARPDVYRERYEHSGPGGTPLPPAVIVYLPDKHPLPEAASNGHHDRDGEL